MTISAGLRLGERYELLGRVATGGMGEVWRGRDTLLARTVAVKLLKSEYVDDQEFLERFRAEARHTAALSHPGIAGVFDYGEARSASGSTAYLVMEYVDGEPLSALLARQRRLPPARVLDIVGQTAFALQAAHDAGVIHRDVKPGNLLLRPDGVVKVTDFGIARAVDAAPVTRTGTVMGTAYYLSPEQATARPVTPASDVYSLGVVAYEALAGRRPFTGDSPVAVASSHLHQQPPPLPPDVPPPVADLVLRALAKHPEDRPGSAGELARAAFALRDRRPAALRPPAAPTAVLARPPRQDRTARLPAAGPAPVRPGGASSAARRRPASRDSSRWAPALLIGAALAILLVVLAVGALTDDEAAGGAVTVPTVEGRALADARALLAEAGLAAEEVAGEPGSGDPGVVTDQDPGAGTEVSRGDTVTLTVAPAAEDEPAASPTPDEPSPAPTPTESEPVTVNADDYVGRPFGVVQSALTELGLRVERVDAEDADGEPGTVVDVSPTGEVEPGETITVSVVPAAPETPASPTATASPSGDDGGDDGGDRGGGRGRGGGGDEGGGGGDGAPDA